MRDDYPIVAAAAPPRRTPRAAAVDAVREGRFVTFLLPFWQRLLLTVVIMLAASWLADFLWQQVFSFPLPSYVAGAVGGLSALPVWALLKRIRPSQGA